MATLANGGNNSKSSRRGILYEFQSKDLPSRRLLGKGLSGIGYETAWKGARRARKDFVGVQRDVFLQEATVLVGLDDHENIVKTYGWTVDKRSCSLVLEYVDEDLLSFLQKRMDSKRDVVGKDLGKQSSLSTSTQPVDLFEAADMSEAVGMMLQIATGVEHLHEQGLVHGDLKTKNILVSHLKDGAQSSKVLKLSDFGLVGTKRKSKSIVSRKVRKLDMVRWKSPESLKILSRRRHSSNCDEDETSSDSESESTPSSVPGVSSVWAGTKSSDVYSFGLICCQILTGHSPYPHLDWKELMVKILSGFRPDLSPVSLHPQLRELLMSCWGDPAERPSFSTVRVKLKRVQGLITTAMGKRPQEAVPPSLADSLAHQAAAGPSTEVSTYPGNCPSSKPSEGPAVVPSGRTASVATVTKNAPGVPLAASSAPSPPAIAAASPANDDEPTQSEDLVKGLEEALLRDVKPPLLRAELPCWEIAVSDLDLRSDSPISPWSSASSKAALASFSMDDYLELLSMDQLDSPSSGLNTDPFTGWDSNLADMGFLGKFTQNEVVIPQRYYRPATGVQTGTVHTWSSAHMGPMSSPFFPQRLSASLLQPTAPIFPQPSSASSPESFKILRNASVPPTSQRKREKSKNQLLLRRCLTLQSELQQGVQTNGAVSQSTASQRPLQRELLQGIQAHGADSPSTVSQGPSIMSSCKSDILSNMDRESFPHYMAPASLQSSRRAILMPHLVDDEAARTHMLSERCRRARQTESFAALRRLLPANSKNDKASILSDAITYLEDLKREIHGLEDSKTQVERQCEDLKLSHQDLERRNQLLEAKMSQAEREYKYLKLTKQDLERRNRLLEARIFQDDREFEDFNSFFEEYRKKRREAQGKPVKIDQFDEINIISSPRNKPRFS